MCGGSNVDWSDCTNMDRRWERYEIWPPRQTTYVILTATDDCSAGPPGDDHNGFLEIEYYALPLPQPV